MGAQRLQLEPCHGKQTLVVTFPLSPKVSMPPSPPPRVILSFMCSDTPRLRLDSSFSSSCYATQSRPLLMTNHRTSTTTTTTTHTNGTNTSFMVPLIWGARPQNFALINPLFFVQRLRRASHARSTEKRKTSFGVYGRPPVRL